MSALGPDVLLERGAELEALTSSLAAARAARGSVVLLEAAAGHGKTALVRVLRERAASGGLRVLGATGAPLERDFAFGIVRQLFEAELHRADDARRSALLAGTAALAEPVFGTAVAGGEDATHSTLYGLYWLCANLAAEQPLLIVVDDAHWADAPSLRFLDALARRVEDLPVLLAIAARPAEPGAEQELLDGLATAPATRLLRPAALSVDGVGELVRTRIDADPEFVAACFETTRGNPLLVTELLRAAPFEGRASEAADVRTTVPGTVARTVTARIRRLSAGALAVARATAVLGDATSVRRVAALSGLTPEAAAAELEVLARAELIDATEGRFIHPMVLEIVDAGLGGERSPLHRRAARLLAEDGAHDGVVATHLLAADPEPDAWAAGVLAAAGRRALAEGAPDVALRLLRRAAPVDAGILLSRGLAEFRTGADPLATLDEAAAGGTPEIAAEAARLAATALILRNDPRGAAARLRAALATAPPELAGELAEQLVEALAYSHEDADEYLHLLETAAAASPPPTSASPPASAASPPPPAASPPTSAAAASPPPPAASPPAASAASPPPPAASPPAASAASPPPPAASPPAASAASPPPAASPPAASAASPPPPTSAASPPATSSPPAHTPRGAVPPALLCHLAHARALAGARKEEVLPPARQALADTRVFARLGVERFAVLWAIEALLAVEAAPEALAATRAMSDLTNRSGSRSSAGAAAWIESRWERRFGNLRRAEDLARLSLELAGDQPIAAMASVSTLIGVLLDRGDEAAARALGPDLPPPGPAGAIVGLYAVHARLLLAEGRTEEALERLDQQHAADAARGWLVGIREDDHVLRVQALAALGRVDEALALADQEVSAALARGARGAEAIARLARAALLPDPLDELEAAVTAARASALPLVLATALADHGAALRRAGRRTDARVPLREARDRAHRCGATALEARIHEELVIAGARPQRLAFSGVDALTASERRVAELAVRGLRNREIAEALFVSLKTVEVHLGRAYTKLGIKGRSQLAEALS